MATDFRPAVASLVPSLADGGCITGRTCRDARSYPSVDIIRKAIMNRFEWTSFSGSAELVTGGLLLAALFVFVALG